MCRVLRLYGVMRDSRYARWREAVQRSMHWVSCEKTENVLQEGRKVSKHVRIVPFR